MKIFRTLLCPLHRGYCTCAGHHEQSLVSALFKVSVGHLFYDVEYGKSLEFWIQKSVRTLKVSAPAPYSVVSARKTFSWPYNKSFIKLLHWPSLFGQGDWRSALYFLCVCVFFFNRPRFRSIREHTKQFGQCSAILTSRLVSDAYMYQRQFTKSGLIFLNVTILVYGNCYKYCLWLRKALNFLVIVFEFDM